MGSAILTIYIFIYILFVYICVCFCCCSNALIYYIRRRYNTRLKNGLCHLNYPVSLATGDINVTFIIANFSSRQKADSRSRVAGMQQNCCTNMRIFFAYKVIKRPVLCISRTFQS